MKPRWDVKRVRLPFGWGTVVLFRDHGQRPVEVVAMPARWEHITARDLRTPTLVAINDEGGRPWLTRVLILDLGTPAARKTSPDRSGT